MIDNLDLYEIIRSVKHGVERCDMLRTKEVQSYQDFIEYLPDAMRDTFARMPATLSDAGAIINLFYSVTMHCRAGEATFRLSSNLILLLRKTDIPNFNLNILKLPYPAIMISLEHSPLFVGDKEILQIYLTQTPTRFRIVAGARDTSVVFLNLVIDPALGVTTITDAVNATVTRTLIDHVYDERRLKPVLNCMDLFADEDPKTDIEKLSMLSRTFDYDRYSEVRTKFFSYYNEIISLAINAVLYITSPEADIVSLAATETQRISEKLKGVKQGLRREGLEKLLAAARKRKIYIVGGGLKIAKELATEFTEAGRKLLLRHQVRGHWKDQPHGPKQELRKHIWVAPYWRGPSYAELLERNYVVR